MPARLVNLVRRHGVALVALFIALGGTSFAVSARGGHHDGHGRHVILGCVGKKTGTLRVVDSFIRCGRLETPISFNRQGRRGHIGHRGRHGARGRTGATGATGSQGLRGPAGERGPTGAKGDPGATGAAGQSVTSAAEPAGANCANGGVRYTSVSGVNFVCNGSGGSDTAAQTLAKLVTVDGSGSGLDADRLDGIDSSGLVRTTQFGDLFDSALGGLFGSDASTESNGSSDLGSHFLAEVYLTAADFPPNGTTFAAGQMLSITANASLFSLIGTTYGGNGTTTFALPDLRRQAPGGLHYVIQTKGVFPSRP